ncbi:MAG: PQQ-dependent dehydrogenase, methanol/ethanol family [Pseudomonadota bacterium]|nr:PQQ-dependent dehydrogenase, methanol/ethanol family [Pseudomonadota bacterium]
MLIYKRIMSALMLIPLVVPMLAAAAPVAGNVDAARLQNADAEPQNWLTGGRDKDGTYYSPLKSINAQNVNRLGFAWTYDLGKPYRGQEATPLVIDGVMYTSGTWGYVYAVDAGSGKQLWRYDPNADHFMARNPCCDLVNRGVAVWKGMVFVASVDGRLHALDAATGKKVWETDTIIDRKLPYSSTGAPQIAGDVVVIGNSGADMGHGAVRGYISAYDLNSGTLKWRFFTVPPAAGQPYENPELAAADKTWDPHRKPEYKGGATAWDGFAYDPNLNLLYFGTANAAPYDLRQLGSEQLDALYATCIIALDATTGRMAWYYQETPHDSWDYDAVQKMVLAEVMMDGVPRSVIMQASKNAFFYVLDRKTGKLLSAKNFAFMNWASHVDMQTGRPVLTDQADWYNTSKLTYPSWFGAHTWNPMSYSPETRLAYIPVIDVPTIWVDLLHNGSKVKYVEGFFTVQGIIPDDTYDSKDAMRLFGAVPDEAAVKASRHVKPVRELIRAWDPVGEKVVWEHETSSGIRGYDGGVMSSAGNLVFQGRGSGALWVYAADTGKVLKVLETGSHIMAAPMTYAVKGEQYVAVQVGYGGTPITVGAIPPSSAALKFENTNRIIAFKLGGGAVPTPPRRTEPLFPKPPEQTATKAQIDAGEITFIEQCTRCHQLGPSTTPDLRKLNQGLHVAFKDILLKGALAPAGMERFDDILSEKDADNVHAYLIEQSWIAYRAQQSTAAHNKHSK